MRFRAWSSPACFFRSYSVSVLSSCTFWSRSRFCWSTLPSLLAWCSCSYSIASYFSLSCCFRSFICWSISALRSLTLLVRSWSWARVAKTSLSADSFFSRKLFRSSSYFANFFCSSSSFSRWFCKSCSRSCSYSSILRWRLSFYFFAFSSIKLFRDSDSCNFSSSSR